MQESIEVSPWQLGIEVTTILQQKWQAHLWDDPLIIFQKVVHFVPCQAILRSITCMLHGVLWVKPVRRWWMAFIMDAKHLCEFLGPMDARVVHDFASFCWSTSAISLCRIPGSSDSHFRTREAASSQTKPYVSFCGYFESCSVNWGPAGFNFSLFVFREIFVLFIELNLA